MADRASDGGEGVYLSKPTIAKQTELGLSTVKRAVAELVERGLIIEAGVAPCASGVTVDYHMNLHAITALPIWRKEASPGPERTRAAMNPAQSGPPTPPAVDPKPSFNQKKKKQEDAGEIITRLMHVLGFDRAGSIPKYWIAPDACLIVARWQDDLGLTADEIEHVARQSAIAHGDPANGPKTLTRAMQAYAAAKAAPPLEASPADLSNATQAQGSPRNVRASEARASDQSIRAVADGIRSGSVNMQPQDPDPFARP